MITCVVLLLPIPGIYSLRSEVKESCSVSQEFGDSSHGEAYRRGSTLVTMGPARDCANRDTSVYPGSGPSRLEVNPYFLPASY
jgi:hypothetical protein